jgi:hypothetical protein
MQSISQNAPAEGIERSGKPGKKRPRKNLSCGVCHISSKESNSS